MSHPKSSKRQFWLAIIIFGGFLASSVQYFWQSHRCFQRAAQCEQLQRLHFDGGFWQCQCEVVCKEDA